MAEPRTTSSNIDEFNRYVEENEPGATPEALFGHLQPKTPAAPVQEPFVNQGTGQLEPTTLEPGEGDFFSDVPGDAATPSLFDPVAELEHDREYTIGEPTTALTFLSALARTDPTKNPMLQLNKESIEETRRLLKGQQERAMRNELASQKQRENLIGLSNLLRHLGTAASPESVAATTEAYNRVLNWDMERRARIAIEETAIDRIQTMAVANPVQAKVLFDLVDKGDADERVRNFNVKQAVLAQRAGEFAQEYEAQGWGKTVFNFMMNLVPLNYNASRAGIVGESRWIDYLLSGSAMGRQSDNLYNMPMEEFIEYTKKDGEFMQSLRSNATTIFDATSDPAMAMEIMGDLAAMTESQRMMGNVWGGVEVASIVPYATIGKVTRSLARSGAPKDAVRNLDNYLNEIDEAGPDAATRATGVDESEFVDEVSISAVKPNRPPDEVPLSEQLATRREAAREALKEFYDPALLERLRTPEEIAAAFEGTADELAAQIGRPVKDVKWVTTPHAGGATTRTVVATVGKKDGHGFATEAAARAATRKMGLAGEPVEVVTTTERVVDPKEGFNLKVYHGTSQDVRGNLRESTTGKMGPGLYTTPNPEGTWTYSQVNVTLSPEMAGRTGKTYPLLVRKEKIWGIDNLEKGWSREEMLSAADELGIPRDEFLVYVDDMPKWGEHTYKSSDFFAQLKSFLYRTRPEGDEPFDLNLAVQDRIREHGYEGMAARFAGDDEIVVFDAGNAVSQLEPVQVFRESSGQWFAQVRKDVAETQWFQDPLHPPAQGFLSKMFGRWFRSSARVSDPELHGRALEVGSRLGRARKVIVGEMHKALDKAPAVRTIALLGARRERWFTPNELDMLIERQFGRRATEAEHEAYGKFQMFNDMDWELRNVAAYVNKVYEGKESVAFTARWGEDFDVDARIDYKLDSIPTERVFNVSDNVHYTKQNNPLTREALEKKKKDGYVIVQLERPIKSPDGITTNLVMLKKTDVEIKPLRQEQIAYAEGGHRMYVDPVYVKQGRKGIQSDTGAEFLEAPGTFRTAVNIAEGKRWADVMNRARLALKENRGLDETYFDDVVFKHDPAYPTGREFLDQVEDGDINLDNPFEAVWNRELPSMYQKSGEDISRLYDEDELGVTGYYHTTGRMYTSAKGKILQNTKGEVAEIIDPYDTLRMSLEQVTRQIGLQNYRIEAVNRFANTYRQYLDVQPNHRSPAQILAEAKVRPDISMEMRNNIEAQRDAIFNILRFETPAEKVSRQAWQNTVEWVIGTGDNAARKFAHDALWWWKERGPIQQLRGLVFDMKLGMFNPGQLLIQISTMVSATALSPKFGWQGMSGLFPMHAYLLSKGSENTLDLLTKRGVWKVMGFDSPDEFKEYARHMHLHGFPDMNGSHVMIRDYGPQAHFGSFSEKGQNLREQARVFFYTAETYNRLVAYRIAWGETKNRGLKATAPNFNETILRLADDYSMNMTNESAAYWQKGILSIPTQFWAYNVRMMDAMLGKRFTPAQRIRLALAQLGMAGTAGIPGLGAVSSYLKDAAGASPPIDSLEGALDRGLIDFVNHQLTGQDILIGERIGTGGWVTETARALFGTSEYGERSFIDIVGGATYSIAKKTAEGGIATMGALAAYAAAESGADMGERAIAGEKLLSMFKEISTFSNITKAMLIHQYGMYKSNKGSVIASNLPPGNAIYTVLTFRPAKTDEISHLMAWQTNKRESIKEVATQLRNWRQEAFSNPDKMEENMQKANALIKLIPVQDRRQVLRQTNSITDKSFYDHIEKKVREEQLRDQIAKGMTE